MNHYFTFLLILFALQARSQETLQGLVLDGDQNVPLVGVNLQINGQAQGTATDSLGRFELEIQRLPIELVVTYVGYQSKTVLVKEQTIVISLYPATNELEEVIVSSKKVEQSLSDGENYSLKDFIRLNDRLIWVEYHGSFKPDKLTLATLNGEVLFSTPVRKKGRIQSLVKSCNNKAFLLTSKSGYFISTLGDSLNLDKSVSVNFIETQIRPCKTKHQDKLYYIQERFNGQQKAISYTSPQISKPKVIQVLGELDNIRRYREGYGEIRAGKRMNTMMEDDYKVNAYLRNVQTDADFLAEVFFKPEFPINVFSQSRDILIFNHPQRQLLVIQKDTLAQQREIWYPLDSKWMKQLLKDESNEAFYGLFNHSKGVALKEIDLATGKSTLTGIMEGEIHKPEKMEIYNGTIYFLRANENSSRRNLMLIQQKI